MMKTMTNEQYNNYITSCHNAVAAVDAALVESVKHAFRGMGMDHGTRRGIVDAFAYRLCDPDVTDIDAFLAELNEERNKYMKRPQKHLPASAAKEIRYVKSLQMQLMQA